MKTNYVEVRSQAGLVKDLQDAHKIIEELACAGWRLMKLAQGAEIESGDIQFSCKEGTFSEEIASQAIRALIRDREVLMNMSTKPPDPIF